MSSVATATRRLRRRRLSPGRPRLRISRQRTRLVVAIAVLGVLLLGGGWLLLRDSSLVAVDHVTVTGASGADAPAIRAALDSAGREMTTLDVNTGQLQAAVSGFPEVTGLRVSTHFPHGLVVQVIELLPVGAVKLAGREVAVTGNGVLLPKVPATRSLPLIALDEPPVGARLPQRWALNAARLLAAAPRRLLPRLAEVTTVAGHGLVVQIRSGPSVYFGDDSQPRAKWIALLAVLADPSSAGALYIDVTDPARPAAGVGASAAQAAGGTSAATGPTSSTGAGGASGGGGSTGAGGTTGAGASTGAGGTTGAGSPSSTASPGG
jgi:cell division septal protein FtsQ